MSPSQGAQSVGMASALTNEVPAAKALFDKASAVLGYDLFSKCVNGPKDELNSTVVVQVAIFVSSMAALEKLKIDDPAAIGSATVAMGLSLGEYSALSFAGVLSFEDGVRLTKARGEAMQLAADAVQSGIPEVQKIYDEVASISGELVAIANYLVAGNYEVSGGSKACEAVREIAPTYGARMAVISNAKPHYEENEIKEILARQVTEPIQCETIVSKTPSLSKPMRLDLALHVEVLLKDMGRN
eukprot:gene22079-28582_t